MQCKSRWLYRGKNNLSLVTTQNSTLVGSHRADVQGVHLGLSIVFCFTTRQYRQIHPFLKVGFCSQLDQNLAWTFGCCTFGKPPLNPKQREGQENGSLWVDFSMCLIACMSRWWSRCGDGPVEVSCSVSLSVSRLRALWMGCSRNLPVASTHRSPRCDSSWFHGPLPQSFLCLAFSLASLVF